MKKQARKEGPKGQLVTFAAAVFLCMVLGILVPVFSEIIGFPKAEAKEPQQQCLQLPSGYSMKDFEAALQMAKERRIERGLLPKCTPGPAAQALERLGRCWDLSYCPKVVTPSVRKAMGCPPLQKKEIHVRAGPNAGNIVKRLEGKGFSCSERQARPGDYTCIKLQKGVCDGKVDKEVLEKCNKKCGQIKDNEEREECIVGFQ